jgi:hypothetical protein
MSETKRMAVLLSGLHYIPHFRHWHSGYIDIDFRHYINNIKDHVYYPFIKQGYIIDFFLCTNHSVIEDELNIYNPVNISFTDNTNHLKKYKGFCDILEHGNKNNFSYDLICSTRFDIYFMKDFEIDKTKLNIFSILEVNHFICDNFYLFPGNMLHKMIEIFKLANDDKLFGHSIINKLNYDEVNFIKNEYTYVGNLTSYKLHYLSKRTYS